MGHTMSTFLPSIGAALMPPATSFRARRGARLDWRVTRRILRALKLPVPERPTLSHHVMWVNRTFPSTQRGGGRTLITAYEFGEYNGCREAQLWSGSGPFDVYEWDTNLPLFTEQIQAMRDWWRFHEGERYGYWKYLRMFYRGLVGCKDWTKFKMTGPGFVCSTSWAEVWEHEGGRKLYDTLDSSIVTPLLIACCPRMKLVARNWRVP